MHPRHWSIWSLGSLLSVVGSSLVLSACGDDGTRAVKLAGAAQKGPLVGGSTISVMPVNLLGIPFGGVFTTNANSELGQYELTLSAKGPVSIEAVGHYYNEVTGELSGAPLTLHGFSILDLQNPDQQQANVNLVTHLTYERIKVLLAAGSDFPSAVRQSEQELRAALGFAASANPSAGGVQLDILGPDTEDNAYALALSTIMVQVGASPSGTFGLGDAGIQDVITRSAADLADDGMLTAALKTQLQKAEQAVFPDVVTRQLKSRLAALGYATATPDLNRVLDSDGDGFPNSRDSCPLAANPEQSLTPIAVCRLDSLLTPVPAAVGDGSLSTIAAISTADGRAGVVGISSHSPAADFYTTFDANGTPSPIAALSLPAGGPQRTTSFAAQPIGDVNGDGATDLLVNSGVSTSAPEGLYLSDPAGGFSSFQQTTAFPYPIVDGRPFTGFGVAHFPASAVVADFDKNGLADMAGFFGDWSDRNVAVQYQTALGQWATPVAVGSLLGKLSSEDTMIAADMNKDGAADLVIVGSSGAQVLLGNGKGGFAAQAPVTTCFDGSCPHYGKVADLDLDGNLDLMVVLQPTVVSGTAPNILGLLAGSASGQLGTMTPLLILPPTTYLEQAFPGDFNGDGRPDIAFTGSYPNGLSLHLLMNTGSGFAAPQSIRIPFRGVILQAPRLNGDQTTDLTMFAYDYGYSNVSTTFGLLRLLMNP